jgi:hypothetical protein
MWLAIEPLLPVLLSFRERPFPFPRTRESQVPSPPYAMIVEPLGGRRRKINVAGSSSNPLSVATV